jgi:alkylation response protein AidB-like acyl-CoA dehydrogenase
MNFSFNDEQKLLQESLEKFIQRDYPFDKRRACQASPQGYSPEVWRQLADMGLLGLTFDADYGGIGGGPIETVVAMTAIGNALMVEPYFPTVVMAGGLLNRSGTAAQKQAVLPAIAEGKLIATTAFGEPGARFDTFRVKTTAKRDDSGEKAGYVLNGRKAVVLFGAQADRIIVSARTSGGANDPHGISLFLVERGAAGLKATDYRTGDGQRAADLVLKDVRVAAEALIGPEGGALALIEAAIDRGAAALAAEAVGVMQKLNALTLEYIKNRQQFGQPIGRFQVLQHRAADMFIHAEQCKSMAYLAAMKCESADAAERVRSVSAAKVYVGRSGRLVAQWAIQMHGGMGVTNELPAAHYAKRLTLIDFNLGDADHHLQRFIRAA